MNYLLVENIDKNKFKVKIDKHLRIEPIKILIPDGYILPESLLQNEKVMKKLDKLGDLSVIEKENITFMSDEI